MGQYSKWLILAMILLLGMFLRVRGLAWGLPYVLDGDEFRISYNGLSVYYTGQQRDTADSSMQSYPPLRSWEIALTRVFLVISNGESFPIGLQVFWGRFFSLSYALLSGAMLFILGKRLSGGNLAGFLAAFFWSMWEVREARLLLADMPALFFFLLALYAGLRGWLLTAWLAGLLAGLAKYNYLPVLIFPLYLTLAEAQVNFRKVAENIAFPLLLILLPLGALFFRTVNLDGIIYDYFDPEAAAEYVEQAQYPLSENDLLQYESHAAGWGGRSQMNLELILKSMPLIMIILAGFGLLRGVNRQMLAILAIMTLQFILISRFRALGARQLLGIMCILILFAGYGASYLMQWRREFIVVVIFIGFWQANAAYQQGDFLRQPDARAAAVDWLLENAPSGSEIISQEIPYEMDELHGFSGQKTFKVGQAFEWDFDWACLGVRYVVWRGEGLGGEILAHFEPPDFTGGAVYLIRLSPCQPDAFDLWVRIEWWRKNQLIQ